MKTFRKIMMAMFVMALVGMTTSCTKDNKDNEGSSDPNNYSAKLVGTWKIDRVTFNGQDATQMMQNVQLSFSANGTGLMNDGGETSHNDFTWVINNNSITVTTRHDVFSFTIVSMTSTECTFSGTNMEMDGQQLNGEILIHMTKVNGGGDNPNPNPNPDTTNFPVNSMWSTSFDTTINMDGQNMTVNVSLGIQFTSLTEGIISVTMVGFPISQQMNFTYTYNATTKSGVITWTTQDEDTEEPETVNIDFVISANNNTLSLVVPEEMQTEAGRSSIDFQRVR